MSTIVHNEAKPKEVREFLALSGASAPSLLTEEPVFDLEALRYDCRLINASCGGYVDLSSGFAVVTGTGWDEIKVPGEVLGEIPYSDFASFSSSGVTGHKGKLVVRRTDDGDIFEWQGRNHAYQQKSLSKLTPLIAIPFISSAFDSPIIVLTQGVGGIGIAPKTYLVVADHIGTENLNLHPGPHEPALFGDMEFTKCGKLYDHELRKLALDSFKAEGIPVSEGVYRFWLSKHFQTGTEIDFEKSKTVSWYDVDGNLRWGPPAVIGKSNVIDAIYAAGLVKPMRVLSVCLPTNAAQPLIDPTAPEEDEILGPDHKRHLLEGREMAEKSAAGMARIFNGILAINSNRDFD